MIAGTILTLFTGLCGAGLEGKTVFLSPGHGFYYHPTLGWTTQRGNTGGLVEDLENADTVFAFLTEYLRRAGADVWPCRCECPSDVEVILDNEDPGYEEEGSWRDTSSGGYSGTARFASTAPGATALARFRPVIPRSGRYPLYVYYIAGSNRAPDALVRVRHGAGTDLVRISQQRHGSTWRYVGTYTFFAGRSQSVEISADSSETGKVVIADALRIGGGPGTMEPNDGGQPSGRLRYEECSVYWARFQGAPASVFNPTTDNDSSDDVTCRPRYSELEIDPGDEGIYISCHTNAGGGTGTETYMYSGGATAGSELLRNLIQEEVVKDIRSAWDPAWVDRGVKAANFGELRLLSSMPGALVETAFHDHAGDLVAERSPRWRKIVSRAIYQAVARYAGGDGALMLPEPPGALSARAADAGAILLSWKLPPSGTSACGAGRAARYRIETSSNGLAFALLKETTATSATIAGPGPGVPCFLRVAALNTGGESLPSRTAAVILPEADPGASCLLVHGFSEDEGALRRTVFTDDTLGDVLRLEPGRAPGGGDSAVEHAWGVRAARRRVAMDFAERESMGGLDLGRYDCIILALGGEGEDVLPESAAQALASFAGGGGRLIVSGSQAARWISQKGGTAARSLLSLLGVSYSGEGQGPAQMVPAGPLAAIGPFGLGGVTDAGSSGAETFDLIQARAGATTVIRTGTGSAAVAIPGRSAFFSFPIESVPEGAFRTALLDGALNIVLGPEEPAMAVVPSPSTVVLQGDRAEATFEVDGPLEASYVWTQEEGPADGAEILSIPWPLGRPGLGYGDDDDVSIIPEEVRGCPSLLLRRSFILDGPENNDPQDLDSFVLDVRYDDGFMAFLNGEEIARRNMGPGSDPADWAQGAIEPEREEIECFEAAASFLQAGENVLALSFHNSSATSSDLTADVSVRASFRGAGVTHLIPPGAVWHHITCGQEADDSWSSPAFDPSARVQTVRFTKPGSYVFSVRAEGLSASSAPERLSLLVLPEGASLMFLRGDANSDGAVDIADAVVILRYLFVAGPASCRSALDGDGTGSVDISDAIFLLEFLFKGGSMPPPPGPFTCGFPPGADDLGCEIPAPACR